MSENRNFSHPVKATEIELHYRSDKGQVTIHKAGCKHAADEKRPTTLSFGADDYFDVAPCAR